DIRVHFASTRTEWEDALRLVEGTYEDHGYEPRGAGCFRFTGYHALPETAVLVAKHGARVVATVSLMPDNILLRMPAELLYPAEIAALRRAGRRLGEVGNFAGVGLNTQELLQIMLTMMKVAWQYHLSNGGDSALITSTPRHGVFYRKALGFVPLGSCRPYPY